MLSTPTSISKQTPKSKPKDKRSTVTDSMWKKFCDTYPKRSGPDPNKSARAKAERCIRTGAQWSDIMTGLRRYRKHCDDTGIETQFIMRKETFLNPTKEFWNSEYADPVHNRDVGVDTAWNTRSAIPSTETPEHALISMADLLGVKRKADETDQDYVARLGKANTRRITSLGTRQT